MTAHLAIVDDRCFHGREQVLDDAIEQWKVSRGQLCNVHVLHTHQQDLMAETQRQTRSVLLKSLVHLKGKDRTMRWVLQSLDTAQPGFTFQLTGEQQLPEISMQVTESCNYLSLHRIKIHPQ